jgi:hypothetical protein
MKYATLSVNVICSMIDGSLLCGLRLHPLVDVWNSCAPRMQFCIASAASPPKDMHDVDVLLVRKVAHMI